MLLPRTVLRHCAPGLLWPWLGARAPRQARKTRELERLWGEAPMRARSARRARHPPPVARARAPRAGCVARPPVRRSERPLRIRSIAPARPPAALPNAAPAQSLCHSDQTPGAPLETQAPRASAGRTRGGRDERHDAPALARRESVQHPRPLLSNANKQCFDRSQISCLRKTTQNRTLRISGAEEAQECHSEVSLVSPCRRDRLPNPRLETPCHGVLFRFTTKHI